MYIVETEAKLTKCNKQRCKMVQVQKGAVKFESIKAMAASLAAKTGEPEGRVYIRLYMRMRAGKNASKAFHQVKRKYNRKVSQVEINTIN